VHHLGDYSAQKSVALSIRFQSKSHLNRFFNSTYFADTRLILSDNSPLLSI